MKRLIYRFCIILCIVCSGVLSGTLSAEDVNLISAGATWKQKPVFFPPAVSEASAKAAGKETDLASRTKMLAKRVASGFDTERLEPDWNKPGFDDYDWLSAPGASFSTGDSRIHKSQAGTTYTRSTDRYIEEIGQLALRGVFQVKDISQVKALKLNVTYRGGVVVYLNGKEIARQSLPAGDLEYNTPADDYPLDAYYVSKDGKEEPLHWWNHRDKQFAHHWPLRERKIENISVDPKLLTTGENIIAVQLHRSNYPVECASKKIGLCFSTIGLSELKLIADTPAANVQTANQRPDGLHVWTAQAWEGVSTASFGMPGYELRPLKIAAAKNGMFPGQLVVSSTADINDLQVTVQDLKSDAGSIKKSQVSIKYATTNPTHGPGFSWYDGVTAARFDLLLDTCPVTIATQGVSAQKSFREILGMPVEPKAAATQPVWIFINVPKDAPADLYKGMVTINAKDADPVNVPVELSISDWVLPDVKDYTPPYFMSQSPDSLAQLYKVEMWSEEHWVLIEKSLKLMGEFGNGGLIFPLMAETCMGNSNGMVTWVKQADGSFTHDFTVFDRYLATAMKYHKPERIKVIGIGVWGYEVRLDKEGNEKQQGKITVRDSAGETSHMILPKYGSAECVAMWKPVLLQVQERLKKYKLEDKLMFGHGGDGSPAPHQVAMFDSILPGTPWYRDSHFNSNGMRYDPEDKNKTVPVGSTSIVWGGSIPDPASKRLYGWKYNSKHIVFNFNRPGTQCLHLKGFPAPWSFRMWMESTITCGRNGNGRVGSDYFKLGVNLAKLWGKRTSSENQGGSSGTLFGSFPQSAVGQIGLGNNTTDLLGPGKDGPVTTIRFENARAGNQEAEARIFIERALLAKSVPEDLAKRCQDHLDQRANALRLWEVTGGKSIGSFGWRQSNQKLFDLAGEVARTQQ